MRPLYGTPVWIISVSKAARHEGYFKGSLLNIPGSGVGKRHNALLHPGGGRSWLNAPS